MAGDKDTLTTPAGDGERRCGPMTVRPELVEYLSRLANRNDATLTDYERGRSTLARNVLVWGDVIAHPPTAAPAPKTGDASLDAPMPTAQAASHRAAEQRFNEMLQRLVIEHKDRLGRLERAVGALVEGNGEIKSALWSLVARNDVIRHHRDQLAERTAKARAALAGEEGS